ncbi:MAG: flagellar basal body rod protein FlgC [Candidimonas sp.]|nr:MAG: flagellar basal body rod protein FlgC [Candidimonas sp.]
MASLSLMEIAGSAMTAQSQRMNVAASNIANADSVAGPDGKPYRAREVVFRMQPLGSATSASPVGGVQVADVIESNAPMRRHFDPGNPAADATGYVIMPNVDVVAETVNMISASRSYQADVEIVNTAKSLAARTLAIGQ